MPRKATATKKSKPRKGRPEKPLDLRSATPYMILKKGLDLPDTMRPLLLRVFKDAGQDKPPFDVLAIGGLDGLRLAMSARSRSLDPEIVEKLSGGGSTAGGYRDKVGGSASGAIDMAAERAMKLKAEREYKQQQTAMHRRALLLGFVDDVLGAAFQAAFLDLRQWLADNLPPSLVKEYNRLCDDAEEEFSQTIAERAATYESETQSKDS